MLKFFLCTLTILAVVDTSHADNGQIAYAVALSKITIDGNLDDWPDNAKKHPINLNASQAVEATTAGFAASFRAGYTLEDKALYLAVEVIDDTHSVTNDSESDWSLHDGIIAYVDFNHSVNGSGSALYLALGDQRRMLSGTESWDADVALASWKNAQAVVKRYDNKSIYEWRLTSPKPLMGNTTIGIDFLIADHDLPGQDSSATLYSWGPGFGKSQAGGRTGDLLLVDPQSSFGVLEGHVGIESMDPNVQVDVPATGSPLRVRVSSTTNPDLWVQTRADKKGDYQLSLPAGSYTVSSVDRTTDGPDDIALVVGPGKPLSVEITADKSFAAPPLVLRPVAIPVVMPIAGALLDFDQRSQAALNGAVEDLMKHYQVPGVSLALVKDGATVFHNTYGVSNTFSGAAVNDNTLFEAASITKAVFAFAVNRLAERGVIDLDRPLYTYLPFDDIAHDRRYQKMTARMVLSHQSGLPNWRWMNDDGKLDIKFYPGIKYGYSGEGFEYLGRVVAHLSGKPLEDILHQEVLKPMGFENNTFFSESPELHQQASRGHLGGMAGPHGFPNEVGVAHSMYTEARTFSAFMLGLLAEKGLSEKGYDKMLEPQVEVPLSPAQQPQWPRRYGLGFVLMNSPFGLAYGHGGNNGNFTCLFEIYPKQGLGFVVFTNADTGSLLANALRQYLITGRG